MKRRRNYTVSRRKIVRRNSKSLISTGENEETIPIDLLIEILSRLPAKSIASFRCVSKQWASLLRQKYFAQSFLTNSSTRPPRLLFAFQATGSWHLFSSLQPQNLGEDDLTIDYYMSFSGNWYNKVCLSSYGFIYLIDTQVLNPKSDHRVPVICNPSTGQQLTLPKVRARNLNMRSFFGYDPILKRHKVLCMTVATYRHQTRSKEHQVLTLGDGRKKLSWRKIECSFPHYPIYNNCGVCINGVIYYIAQSGMSTLVACFDVRSENFSFIDAEKFSRRVSILMKYKDKLGVITYVYGIGGHYELWVLDDKENDKWSKYVLLNTRYEEMKSVWANDTGVIFWVQYCWSLPFYVNYYIVEVFGKN